MNQNDFSERGAALQVAVGGLVLLIPPYFLQGSIDPIRESSSDLNQPLPHATGWRAVLKMK